MPFKISSVSQFTYLHTEGFSSKKLESLEKYESFLAIGGKKIVVSKESIIKGEEPLEESRNTPFFNTLIKVFILLLAHLLVIPAIFLHIKRKEYRDLIESTIKADTDLLWNAALFDARPFIEERLTWVPPSSTSSNSIKILFGIWTIRDVYSMLEKKLKETLRKPAFQRILFYSMKTVSCSHPDFDTCAASVK